MAARDGSRLERLLRRLRQPDLPEQERLATRAELQDAAQKAAPPHRAAERR